MATAFGVGAAGVVAPTVSRPAVADWLATRPMRVEEASPFVSLNGTCPPASAAHPDGVGGYLRVQRRAHDAAVPGIAAPAQVPQLRGRNRRRRFARSHRRNLDGFPEFRLIRQPNKGLSVARNVGLFMRRAARLSPTPIRTAWSIPHWLTLMVRAMVEGGLRRLRRSELCAARRRPGRGLRRRRAGRALSRAGRRRSRRASGRMQHGLHQGGAGGGGRLRSRSSLRPATTSTSAGASWTRACTLGYCPAAFVWHFRRNTVKAYYGQQRGYGRAEAALYLKYPERFNALGQIKWRGTIPGLARDRARRVAPQNIGWTRSGRRRADGARRGAGNPERFLPQTLEWNLVVLRLRRSSPGSPALRCCRRSRCSRWAWCGRYYYAWQAPLEKCHDSLGSRMFVAFLAWSGPMVRTWTRWKTRMRAVSLGSETPAASAPDAAMARPQPPSLLLERGVDHAREPARASDAELLRAPGSRSRRIPDGTISTSKFVRTPGRGCASRPPTRSTRERG